jgi:hypothetical protein
MTIDEIYTYFKPLIVDLFSHSYKILIREIENDSNFSLNSDEQNELFDEIMLIHLHDTMTAYEWDRIIKTLK